ncbi:MAG TPA: efflux RND transporter periplasmic adaptor subunit [Gemmataceae bacterium]|nr:efflux RND transporter periplasmic adaptor subunit [Gemmataceae bacterium]
MTTSEGLTLRGSVGKPQRLFFSLTAVALLFLMTTGCQRAAPPNRNKVIEVFVTTPITDEVTDYQDFTGRMEALMTVDVRPRVSGYVMQAPFKEGDLVKEGDLLFEIDPRTYKSDLELAEANLRQAEAETKLQTQRASRARLLIGTNSISPEDYDQIIALRDKAIATVGAMKASRDRAQLYLGFTRVVAPLSGRISRRLVDPGNLVNADQTILTTIVTEEKMYTYFDVDERTYLDLKTMTSGSTSWFSSLNFPVLMRLANEESFTHKGDVNFLDNRLNGNTGTVRMRALFDNSRGILKSGLFARIRLPIGVPYKTLLIPDEALQSDQGRKYVYVVKKIKDDKGEEVDKVEYRAVKHGQAIDGLRSIKEGLKEGERVIVTGMQRVRPGVTVQAKMQDPPSAPKSSLTKMLSENRPTVDPSKQAPVPDLKDLPRLPSRHPRHEGKHQR